MATPVDSTGDFAVFERLRGHKGQVLCVAAPDAKVGQPLLATGSEDSTVRLWDLRAPGKDAQSSPRVVLCVCRCFEGEAVSSIVFKPGDPDRLYCSAGGQVLEFDLRASAGGLLLTSATATLDTGREEVNELAVHPKGEFLAAADDSGDVKIYDTRARRVHKTLRRAHSSIAHAVRFRPRSAWDLASGALDSTLVFWDFGNGRVRRKLDFVHDSALLSGSASSSTAQQVLNPPFVNSVDYSADGRFLATGLGDGGVVVFDAKLRAAVGRYDGHSAPVSQVHYPAFDSRLLVSAGNDKRLLLWDHLLLAQQAAIPNVAPKQSPSTGSGGNGTKSGEGKSGSARDGVTRRGQVDGGSLAQGDGGSLPRRDHVGGGLATCQSPLSSDLLEEKPNWLSSVAVPYDALVVADTTAEAKVLTRLVA